MKPEPALSWKSGPCCCGIRGKNCSKPGGTWNCGPSCWRRSVCPDLMNTTLGFTCSATEAKASLRSDSAATLPDGAGLVVATAGALGCCADERWGRCRTPASSRPARNASPTLPDRARLNHPCDMSSSPRREPADGPGTWPGLTVQQMHGPARALHGRGNAAGSVTFENDGGAPGRPARQDVGRRDDDGEGHAEDVPHHGASRRWGERNRSSLKTPGDDSSRGYRFRRLFGTFPL